MSESYFYTSGYTWEITSVKMESSRSMGSFGVSPLNVEAKFSIKTTKIRDLEFFKNLMTSCEKISTGFVTSNNKFNYRVYGIIITGFKTQYHNKPVPEITADFICDYFEPTNLTNLEISKIYNNSIKGILINDLNLKY